MVEDGDSVGAPLAPPTSRSERRVGPDGGPDGEGAEGDAAPYPGVTGTIAVGKWSGIPPPGVCRDHASAPAVGGAGGGVGAASTQKTQPAGAAGQAGSGCQSDEGEKPGGTNQPGGGLKCTAMGALLRRFVRAHYAAEPPGCA